MVEMDVPPASAEELRSAILDRYESLSKRLQQIARYVLDEPNAVALETLAVLTERCSVQPSAIGSFALSCAISRRTRSSEVMPQMMLLLFPEKMIDCRI